MLAGLIQTHAAAAAAAENWAEVATALNALQLRAAPAKCRAKQTAVALTAAGCSWANVAALFEMSPTGRLLLNLLASEGVAWADPLTVPFLQAVQGTVLTQAGVNALIDLSAPLLHASLTAEQCEAAVLAETARHTLQQLRTRRDHWDTVAAAIRGRIETGELNTSAAILDAVATTLEA